MILDPNSDDNGSWLPPLPPPPPNLVSESTDDAVKQALIDSQFAYENKIAELKKKHLEWKLQKEQQLKNLYEELDILRSTKWPDSPEMKQLAQQKEIRFQELQIQNELLVQEKANLVEDVRKLECEKGHLHLEKLDLEVGKDQVKTELRELKKDMQRVQEERKKEKRLMEEQSGWSDFSSNMSVNLGPSLKKKSEQLETERLNLKKQREQFEKEMNRQRMQLEQQRIRVNKQRDEMLQFRKDLDKDRDELSRMRKQINDKSANLSKKKADLEQRKRAFNVKNAELKLKIQAQKQMQESERFGRTQRADGIQVKEEASVGSRLKKRIRTLQLNNENLRKENAALRKKLALKDLDRSSVTYKSTKRKLESKMKNKEHPPKKRRKTNVSESVNDEVFSESEDESHSEENETSNEKQCEYVCVCWRKQSKKWKAAVMFDGKLKYGGLYKEALDAAHAVNIICDDCNIPRKNHDIGDPPAGFQISNRNYDVLHASDKSATQPNKKQSVNTQSSKMKNTGKKRSNKEDEEEEDSDMFEVGAILRRVHRHKILIRWKGYGPEHDSEEPVANFKHLPIYQEFLAEEQKQKEKEKKREEAAIKNELKNPIAFGTLMIGDAWASLQCKPYSSDELKKLLRRYDRTLKGNAMETRRSKPAEKMPPRIRDRILVFNDLQENAKTLVLLRWWNFREEKLKTMTSKQFKEEYGELPFKIFSDIPFGPAKDKDVLVQPPVVTIQQRSSDVKSSSESAKEETTCKA